MKVHYRNDWGFDYEGEKIEKLFKEVLPYQNMLTPIVVAYFENDEYIVELTKQETVNNFGFMNQEARGVSTINRKTKKHERELSELLDNEEEAIEYIGKILGEKNDNIQSAG